MTSLLNRIGIDGYQVLRTEASLPLKIHVKPEARTCSCPCCGGGRLHSKGRYQKQVRHLDRFGEPTTLVVHTRRLRCRDCHHCFVPPLPGILAGRHSSEPFREDAYRQHDNGICVSTLARILHIGSATIERIYHQFTERKAKERCSLRCPMVLGIDENTLHKSQRFATTFVDLEKHRVFNVVPGRSPRELAPFVCRLQGREHVRVVCIDLSGPYRALIRKWFPNAKIVASRFEPLITLANTLRSWAEPIACMWRFTRNNGITEGFYRKMKLIQRRAYGFRNFSNYQIRVLAVCGELAHYHPN